jgi:dipeptidyl aminopeptidase/acylaminoacyl peptidase
VAYWGYGDLLWYVEPSTHYRKDPLIGRDQAFRNVGQGVVTGGEGKSGTQRDRSTFYRYLRQNGIWIQEVAGLDPQKNRRELDRYCPIRNLSPDYPPTLMVHGTADEDVPYSESAAMDKELARLAVPHELVTVEGAGHGLSGVDRSEVDAAYARSLEFIRKHLK